MARANGIYSITRFAKLVCKFITRYAPGLKQQFPTDLTLHVALDAALLACAVLVDELNDVAPVGV